MKFDEAVVEQERKLAFDEGFEAGFDAGVQACKAARCRLSAVPD